MAIVVSTIKLKLGMESVTRKGREVSLRAFAIPCLFLYGGMKDEKRNVLRRCYI